jgi:type IV secretion system protein VirD4
MNLLTGLRWATFLGLVGVTLYYWTLTNGHLLTSNDAANHITLAAVLWAATLFRKNYKTAGGGLHGTATWATRRDLRGLLQWGRTPAPGGFLVGKFGLRQLVLPPALTPQHTLIVGPSGSGKTRAELMPNCALAEGSFVVTDPKGELWQSTSGEHRDPWRFAPREPERSRCCNWIPLCADSRLCDLLARAAMQTDRQQAGDPFWGLAEAQVCSALFAHAATLPLPTPLSAYHVLTAGPRTLLATFAASRAPSARQCAAALEDLKPELLASIVLGVSNRLSWLKEPAVQRFTSAELTAPDFTILAQRPTAVYWVLHEQDVALLQPLSSIFFTLLLEQLGRGRLETPVLLLLDEFANLGVLPNFPTTISVARGRGIALVLGVQALGQLDGLYGQHGAETIRVNCATKIVMHGLDFAGADAISRSLGEQTVQHQARSSDDRWSEQQVRRPLLTADEVRRIGNDELVVLVSNRRPAKVRKQWHTAGPRTADHGGLGAAQGRAPAMPSAPLGPTPAAGPHRAGRD